MDAGDVFGLGHLERECEGAFLAFAAELRGGLVVQEQLQVVEVRADERGAAGEFTSAGLAEFDGDVLLHTGLVFVE